MRRSTGASRELQVRIALVLVLLAAFYLAIAAAVGAAYLVEPSWWPYITPFVVAIVGVTVLQSRGTGARLLRSAGARLVDRGADPTLTAQVERFAALADIDTPLLAVVRSDRPNAFSVTLKSGQSCVVVTTGLVKALDDGEVEAVLAHEVAHIANRDARVMTIASGPRALGITLLGSSDDAVLPTFWFFLWWFGLPLWLLGTALLLVLSRYREFAADHGSALLTGRPELLMSALVKLDGRTEIPEADLRKVDALCIVQTTRRPSTLRSAQPPVEARLNALGRIARNLGRPAGGNASLR